MVAAGVTKKRGRRPELADDDPALDPTKLQRRLARQAQRAAAKERDEAAVARGEVALPAKPGRKRLSDEMLTLPGHEEALRKRKRKASASCEPVPVLTSSISGGLIDYALTSFNGLIEACTDQAEQAAADQAAAQAAAEAAVGAAVEQTLADLAAAEIHMAVEQAAAQLAAEKVVAEMMAAVMAACLKAAKERERKAAKKRRVAANLASDGGYVDEARSRSKARMEHACFICLESHTDAYMPCCGQHVHRACIARWHGMDRNKTKHQAMAPKQGGGWKPVDMARLHQCPHCGAEMLSARVHRL